VAAPTTNTVTPKPAITHSAGRLAAMKSAPVMPEMCELRIDPTIATPSPVPMLRLVVATAAATPAWLRGIPDTAVFVIGALTTPCPTPNAT
jgi:hypothetical protein